MNATEPLVLPADLLFLPATALDADTQARLGASETDRVLSRTRVRVGSMVIDAPACAFVEEFRSPTTVVDAVLRHAARTGEDPEAVLESAVVLVARLRQRRFLTPSGATEARAVEPSMAAGSRVDELVLGTCVHIFEDVEVYEAWHGERTVALKLLRPEAGTGPREMLEREACVLEDLAGGQAPELLGRGIFDGRPYLVQGWCDGVSAASAAARLRQPSAWSRELLQLASATIRAYVGLHGRGVVHADVHPGNVLVGLQGDVRILDYGLSVAASASHLPSPRRGGTPDYFEPEYCGAILAGDAAPAATMASDQYALAALLYLMLTGLPRRAFSLERAAWLREVAEGGMDPFGRHGLAPWPALESVLARALRAHPAERYPSVTAMAAAFDAAVNDRPANTVARHLSDEFVDFADRVVSRVAPDGLPTRDAADGIKPPRCSVNFGGAGIAWFLYRLACARGDARLLAAADVWIARTHALANDPSAFASPDIRITPLTVGSISPFHYRSGAWLVDAHVAAAMGDARRAARSGARLVEACADLGDNPDLTLGWSSVLLACSALLETSASVETAENLDAAGLEAVRALGGQVAGMVADWLSGHSPGDPMLPWYGIAHGWAGLAFALLRWSQATREAVPEVVAGALDSLAGIGQREGGRIRWPVRPAGGDVAGPASVRPQTGWCHGSAGYLQLWTLAGRTIGDEYLDLARGAERDIAFSMGRDGNRNASLCCGFAGQGYALLAYSRWTGDQTARDLAFQAADHARRFAPGSNRPDSLYKGDIGIAALITDLGRPGLAAMPIFEAEAP